MRLAVLAALGIFLFVGCPHFEVLPSVQQYARDEEGTLRTYPQLEEYSPSVFRVLWEAPWGGPSADELVEQWGEPDNWRWSWLNLWPPGFLFHFPTTWFWNAGDRRVYAVISHSLIMGYSARVWMIGVEDRPPDDEELSKEEERKERKYRKKR